MEGAGHEQGKGWAPQGRTGQDGDGQAREADGAGQHGQGYTAQCKAGQCKSMAWDYVCFGNCVRTGPFRSGILPANVFCFCIVCGRWHRLVWTSCWQTACHGQEVSERESDARRISPKISCATFLLLLGWCCSPLLLWDGAAFSLPSLGWCCFLSSFFGMVLLVPLFPGGCFPIPALGKCCFLLSSFLAGTAPVLPPWNLLSHHFFGWRCLPNIFQVVLPFPHPLWCCEPPSFFGWWSFPPLAPLGGAACLSAPLAAVPQIF